MPLMNYKNAENFILKMDQNIEAQIIMWFNGTEETIMSCIGYYRFNGSTDYVEFYTLIFKIVEQQMLRCSTNQLISVHTG